MTQIYLYIRWMVVVVCFCFPVLYADASEFVTAEGSGENKTESIHDAQRNAVSQVLGVMLTSETLMENFLVLQDKILTRVSGYVKNYSILSQACTAGECTSTIRAEVESMDLADDVAALAGLLPRMNYPSTVVSITQKAFSHDMNAVSIDLSTVEQKMQKVLGEKGFHIVEPSAKEAEKLRQATLMSMTGDPLGSALETASHLSQVMISGQAAVQDNGGSPYNDKLHSYGAFISAKAYQTGTGGLLASGTGEANAVHHSFVIGAQKALEKASEQLIEKLSKQIVQAWIDDCYNDNDITLIVEDIPFGKVRNVMDTISSQIKGVNRVNQKSYLRSRAQILIGWRNCNTQRFAEKLAQVAFPSERIEINEVQGNIIRVGYTRR